MKRSWSDFLLTYNYQVCIILKYHTGALQQGRVFLTGYWYALLRLLSVLIAARYAHNA